MSNIINLVKMSYSNLNSVKKILLITILIFIAISMYDTTFLNMLIGIVVYSTVYQVMAYEDMYEINKLIGYLPVTRKEYVISRYFLGILNVLLGIIVFAITFKLSSAFGIANTENLNFKLMLLVGITSSVLLLSVSIPMILKLGIVKGRFISTFVMFGIIMIPGFIVNDIVEVEGLENILRYINNLGTPIILSILNIIALLISYNVAKGIYFKKSI